MSGFARKSVSRATGRVEGGQNAPKKDVGLGRVRKHGGAAFVGPLFSTKLL